MPDASAAANRAASPPASRTRGRHPTRVVSRRLTADELYNIEQLSDIATRKGWRSFKMHEAEVTLPWSKGNSSRCSRDTAQQHSAQPATTEAAPNARQRGSSARLKKFQSMKRAHEAEVKAIVEASSATTAGQAPPDTPPRSLVGRIIDAVWSPSRATQPQVTQAQGGADPRVAVPAPADTPPPTVDMDVSEREREAGKRDAADAGVASPPATGGGSCRDQGGGSERGGGKGPPRKRLSFREGLVEELEKLGAPAEAIEDAMYAAAAAGEVAAAASHAAKPRVAVGGAAKAALHTRRPRPGDETYARLSSSAALKLRDEAAAKWAARGIPEEALDVIYWNYQALDWINRIDLEDLGVSPEVIDRLGPADSDGDFELYKGAKDGGWQDEGDE